MVGLPLAFLGPLLALVVSDDKSYVSERFGFGFERPSETWAYYGTESQPGALFCVSTFPKGTEGLPSFVVYVTALDERAGAEPSRDAGAKLLETKGGRLLDKGMTRIADRDACWFRGRAELPTGVEYEVRYLYVASKPFLYTLQFARAAADKDAAPLRDALTSSFSLFPAKPAETNSADESLKRLSARCGSEIEWCATWDAAASRAKEQGKLVLVVVENYAALNLPETARSGVFMDPDVVAMVNERFVAFALGADDEAPFRSPEVYGLGKHAWGTSFLFVRPNGDVFRETANANASYLAEFARGVLEEASPSTNRAEPRTADPLAHVETCLRRGELQRAEKLIGENSSPRAHWLRARLFGLRRQGEQALDELRAARRDAPRSLEPEIAADEAIIQMRLGRAADAEQAFERVVKEWPESPRVPECWFWLGAFECLRQSGNPDTTAWRRLVEKVPENRWAWKAAANLLKEGNLVNGGERLDWPEDVLVASVARSRPEALRRDQVTKAERDAVAYLLASQQSDGAWIVPIDAFSLGSNLYTTPITAICARSLIPRLADDPARDAVKKALGYVLEIHRSGRMSAGTDLAGVYSIWGRVFVLWFLASCSREHIGDAREIESVMKELVASIEKSQHKGGGWPYVTFPGDPTGSGFDPSSTFLTAGVLHVLLDVRESGVTVSKDAIANGLRFLDRSRQKDGIYRYMPDAPSGRSADARAEAVGRGPACAFVLQRGGLGGVDLVRDALKQFLEHRVAFKKEWHKALCHTGPEGLGAHYLLYDYWFASLAVRVLPTAERSTPRNALLADVLDARFADGSFEDFPPLGRAYGTAMALLVLREFAAAK